MFRTDPTPGSLTPGGHGGDPEMKGREPRPGGVGTGKEKWQMMEEKGVAEVTSDVK